MLFSLLSVTSVLAPIELLLVFAQTSRVARDVTNVVVNIIKVIAAKPAIMVFMLSDIWLLMHNVWCSACSARPCCSTCSLC